jgi:hypothetical protein
MESHPSQLEMGKVSEFPCGEFLARKFPKVKYCYRIIMLCMYFLSILYKCYYGGDSNWQKGKDK